MNIKLIKLGSVDQVNKLILNLEHLINTMKHTPYNGFNYDKSFVNYKKINDLKSDLDYLIEKRADLFNYNASCIEKRADLFNYNASCID